MMKIAKRKGSSKPMDYVIGDFYDNYVAIDWSTSVMSISKMSSSSRTPIISKDLPATVKAIKDYLKELRGKVILTIEETTGAQWLYVEIKDYVDKIIICNPYRNSLLKDGPKNDHKDSSDLCRLLRAGLLKEVYHSNDENYKIRKLTSSYSDLINGIVRAKNQLSAIYRSLGKNYKKDTLETEDEYFNFIITEKKKTIEEHTQIKKEYFKLFRKIMDKNRTIKNLTQISGIGLTNAVKLFSVVIDANRFPNKYKYWSYSGLVKYKMESGGKLYGKKNTKYNRILKEVYKTATQRALQGKNDIREYYETMLKEAVSEKEARNTITRYIAKSTYAMMKNNTKYKPYSWRKLTLK